MCRWRARVACAVAIAAAGVCLVGTTACLPGARTRRVGATAEAEPPPPPTERSIGTAEAPKSRLVGAEPSPGAPPAAPSASSPETPPSPAGSAVAGSTAAPLAESRAPGPAAATAPSVPGGVRTATIDPAIAENPPDPTPAAGATAPARPAPPALPGPGPIGGTTQAMTAERRPPPVTGTSQAMTAERRPPPVADRRDINLVLDEKLRPALLDPNQARDRRREFGRAVARISSELRVPISAEQAMRDMPCGGWSGPDCSNLTLGLEIAKVCAPIIASFHRRRTAEIAALLVEAVSIHSIWHDAYGYVRRVKKKGPGYTYAGCLFSRCDPKDLRNGQVDGLLYQVSRLLGARTGPACGPACAFGDP